MKNRLLIILVAYFCTFSTITVFSQNIVWKKNFGGNSEDIYYSVAALSDGTVAVGYSYQDSFGTGDWTEITGKGDVDAIIVKYNNDGYITWKKHFGGSSHDHYNSVVALSDGMVAVGCSEIVSDGDWTGVVGRGWYDAIIVKYNNDGNTVWKNYFGGNEYDEYNSVTVTTDGIIAVGYSRENSFSNGDWTDIHGKGDWDAIIVKYGNDGNVIWKKNFGGSGQDNYLSISTVSDGIIAVGYSEFASFGNGDWTDVWGWGDGDAIIVKYDNDGNVIWKKHYYASSSYNTFFSVNPLSDGIVAVGFSSSNGRDAIIVKYDNDGNMVWEKKFGGMCDDFYYSVTTVSDGIVAVGYSDACSFGNGDWANITVDGDEPYAIIVKYDNDGNVVWKKPFGGRSTDRYNSVTTVSENIIAAGFSYYESFGSGDWSDVLGKGSFDAIIVKYTEGEVGFTEMKQHQEDFKIYPNPTNGKIKVEVQKPVSLYDIAIFDVMGKSLDVNIQDSSENSKTGIVIDISHLSAGIYFLHVENEVTKIIKE